MPEPEFLQNIRASFDAVAEDYAARFAGELPGKPFERAMLVAFAELVRAAGGGPVADVGCGPGHVTGYLRDLGLDAFGIDLSPAMVAVARRRLPDVRFEIGSMLALDLPDGALGGLVAMYSVINLPRDRLSDATAEFARVLAPGAPALLVFQVGDEDRHGTEWLGHPVDLEVHYQQPDLVAGLLAGAGLPVRARLLRGPDDDGVERGPRAVLVAVRS